MGDDRVEVALHDFCDIFGGDFAFVQLKDGHEQGEFDIDFLGCRGSHCCEKFEGLAFGVFVVVEVLFGGRCHSSEDL